MKVPLSLLLCFPVISLSIALPPETGLPGVKTLFRRVAPLYHYDTRRGSREWKRPDYPTGSELFASRRKRKTGKGVVFEINPLSHKLKVTQSAHTQASLYRDKQELTSEHLVEVSQTFEFAAKVMGYAVEKLGDSLDIRWLIIENIKYSIDRPATGAGAGPSTQQKEYFEPIIHLKFAVGSNKFKDQLVVMTKELNGAKTPLIHGEPMITDAIWERQAGPKDKFELAAKIAVVAETAVHNNIRTWTGLQMKRLTQTIATWDQLYAAWYCEYESKPEIWGPIKQAIEADLCKAKANQEIRKTEYEADYAARKQKDSSIPENDKVWPEINDKLPEKPPNPKECSETFEQRWISYQNGIYERFKEIVTAQLGKAKQNMEREYGPSGTLLCTDDPQTKADQEKYLEAVKKLTLPEGWVSGTSKLIAPGDFAYGTKATIAKEPTS